MRLTWQTAVEKRQPLRLMPTMCLHDPPCEGRCFDVDITDLRPAPRTWKRRGLRLHGRFIPLGKWRPQ